MYSHFLIETGLYIKECVNTIDHSSPLPYHIQQWLVFQSLNIYLATKMKFKLGWITFKFPVS